MAFWFALMLGTAAPATPALEHEATSPRAQTLDARAQRIADLLVAKQLAEATALVDPLLEDYEKANAGESAASIARPMPRNRGAIWLRFAPRNPRAPLS